MHSLTRFFCFVAVVLLVSCTAQKYKVQAARENAACKIRCQQGFNACNHVCHKNCRQCSVCANEMSVRSYNQYKHEQCVQGGIIVRQLNSYRDPLQCRKPTCNCLADYRVCTQACAGIIQKRLQVGPTCC